MTHFQKFIVSAYRYLAAGVLIAILSTGVGYGLITLFYTANSSWAAPILISQTHERILQLQAELFRSRQAMGMLDSGLKALDAESAVLKAQEATLTSLLDRGQSAQEQQRKEDKSSAAQLAPLTREKAADVARTSEVIASLSKQEASVSAELAAGLITEVDAASRRAAFNALKVSATESAIARASLHRQFTELKHSSDTLAGQKSTSAAALELMSRLAQLQNELAHVRLKLNDNRMQIANKTLELAKLKSIVARLADSPYYRVTVATSPLSFAFIPYSNENGIKVDEPVYDCVLQVLWCTKVGVVKRVHHDEERAQHPLFRADMRGFLVEMELTQRSAAKSRVVFIGNAPLFL